MIKVTGTLRNDYESRSVTWQAGRITGDEVVRVALITLSIDYDGTPLVHPGGIIVEDWLSTPMGFARLCLAAFSPGVEIVTDAGEVLAPPPPPRGAVA